MTKKSFFLSALLGASLLAAIAPGVQAQTDKITPQQLREMFVQLGYQVTDLNVEAGKEKYTVTIVRDELNIPIGGEISPSGSYIWLTANLGPSPTAEKAFELLRLNADIQPTFFYVTKSGRLMCALAIENRSVTSTIIQQKLNKFAADIGSSKTTWQQP